MEVSAWKWDHLQHVGGQSVFFSDHKLLQKFGFQLPFGKKTHFAELV